ncbi:hypothetical protein J2Z66_004635 [Paenibacillus eucommiae]|uniref:Uncharacterized protein n=1 Tax=Paenibacillus eucommiae TaxID=1355755 RepID=A0ABS4IZJ9_9BACL|nr:hypothetical protein [Paenibacillus eucommiae]
MDITKLSFVHQSLLNVATIRRRDAAFLSNYRGLLTYWRRVEYNYILSTGKYKYNSPVSSLGL